MKKALPFSYYFLYFAALATFMPFLVLYYQQLGFSGGQIGLLSGITPLISLAATPFWTGLADSTRRHKAIMSLAMGSAVLAGILIPFVRAFWPLLVLLGLYIFIFSPASSLADAATMGMLGGERARYGRIRLGGTLGWAIAAPLAGMLVQTRGIESTFYGYAALMFLGFLVTQGFVFQESGLATKAKKVDLRAGARRLLADPHWVLFLIMSFITGLGIAAINNYFYPYMAELQASKTMMGLALTISTIGELPVLFFSDRLLKRFGSYGLLVIGMGATGLRLLLYAALGRPDAVLVSQLMNGLGFPIFWVAGVSYAYENSPAGLSATTQGLFGAMVFGFGSAAGGLLGGLLLDPLGGRGLYLVFGILVLVSLAALTLIRRQLPAQVAPAGAGDPSNSAAG